MTNQDIHEYFEKYRKTRDLPEIKDFGMAKEHDPRSVELFGYISEIDYGNGDYFCFKSGGDGDNGEILMDLLDCFFQSKDKLKSAEQGLGTER